MGWACNANYATQTAQNAHARFARDADDAELPAPELHLGKRYERKGNCLGSVRGAFARGRSPFKKVWDCRRPESPMAVPAISEMKDLVSP